MGEVMPKEQQEFIDELEKYILEASNLNEDEAYLFAFRVWQHRKYLKQFLTKDDECTDTIDWEHECKMLQAELQTCCSDRKILAGQLDIVKLIFGGNKS